MNITHVVAAHPDGIGRVHHETRSAALAKVERRKLAVSRATGGTRERDGRVNFRSRSNHSFGLLGETSW